MGLTLDQRLAQRLAQRPVQRLVQRLVRQREPFQLQPFQALLVRLHSWREQAGPDRWTCSRRKTLATAR